MGEDNDRRHPPNNVNQRAAYRETRVSRATYPPSRMGVHHGQERDNDEGHSLEAQGDKMPPQLASMLPMLQHRGGIEKLQV